MHSKRIKLSVFVLLIVSIATLVSFYLSEPRNRPPAPEISGTLLPIPKPLETFQLTDHQGQRFGIEQLKGHWSFLFFGYTHCSDICPTTLLMFKNINSKLERKPDAIDNVKFILVSLDPGRDSTEHLKQYIQNYHEDFIALTGKPEQIKQFATQSWIYYIHNEAESNSNDNSGDRDYLIDHSAAILLLNPSGEIHAIFGAPHDAEKITADFIKIREMNI